ncbi:facilitated trehalose transporter Tret1-like [Galleria mellonella]|uniref:Facilitated trehalose transporter Tret1-like n=1 Tax=Galleria mellonella TaxID=7137 RepID=A0A6J1WR15_GALME|nr:facilitated trehalose transporter Tret1-like [Galleria mellonella]
MKEYLRKQIFVSLCVYLGQVLVGYAMGWSAPVIAKLDDPNQSPLPGPITQGQSSWIASLLYIGCIIGPNISSYLSNTKGRKLCFFIAGVLIIFSFILLAAARNLVMIYTGRVTIGLGIGIIAVLNLVYIGEIASTNIRGILLTGTGIFSTLGTLLIYSVGPYVSYASTSYIGLCLSILYIVGLYFIPETPLFYIMQGQSEAAETALVALGRQDEIDNILNMRVKKDQKSIAQLKELVSETSNRNALIITLTLSILQQMSGVVVVVFFATTIFELAGSSIHPNVATIVIGITQLVSSCIAPFVVEKGGRKVLLLFSTTICANSLAILGIYFFMDSYDYPNIEKVAWLPLVTLIIFFLSYDFGFGIIPGTFAGEMFQPQLRSIGSAVTVTTAWLFGFGISTAFGYMISELGGHITFWFYSGACAVATLFTIFYIPETKGKTLEEVQEMLR